MTSQTERRTQLLTFLLEEANQADQQAGGEQRGHINPATQIPKDEKQQWQWLRSLMNIRPPKPIPSEIISLQDTFLQAELATKPISTIDTLTPSPQHSQLYLWQGDITTLAVDGIVNACNSALLGCFSPCHGCIDNAIHTFAGMQLRLACADIMTAQGHSEANGQAKITPAFNLPAKHILHTVGPIIYDTVTEQDRAELASCYRACLTLADDNGLQSIAFCCLSTGEFRFPNQLACAIAIATVKDYLQSTQSPIKVVFNVFTDKDLAIYQAEFDKLTV